MEYETHDAGTSAGINGYEPESSTESIKSDVSYDPDSGSFREFYSIGIDTTPGLKEKISEVHGPNSRQVHFVGELEDYFGDSKKYRQASKSFETYVRNHIQVPRNAEYLVNEFINAGYITALERLGAPGSGKSLDFYSQYAESHDMTIPQVFLFGPNGTARQAFHQWQIEELLRGQHRGKYKPENQQMAEMYDKAIMNTCDLPKYKNKAGDIVQKDINNNKRNLPEGLESEIVKALGREKSLHPNKGYKGTKRLSGNLPYKIIEAVTTEILNQPNVCRSGRFNVSQSELERIIEDANGTGQDVFLALYNHFGKNDVLKEIWNKARKKLNNYAEILWQQRDNFGKQVAARARQELPGTIYLNNGRYYWLSKQGEKVFPLIPEKEKNRLPGSLYKNKPGGYFWWIPHLKFRRRMVPKGQKNATRDLETAQKLQRQEWENIQKYEPKLAKTLTSMRKWGVATKHKPTAVKIAKKLWRQMQQEDPRAVARIRSDKRPEKDKPEIDRVWPGWSEQKARLARMEDKPQIPIVYPPQALHEEWKYGLRVPKALEPMVDKIKQVDWLVRDGMLVFEDTPPAACGKMARQSKGEQWAKEQEAKGKRFSTQGSASIDKDTGRIRFTVYSPGYGSERTLAEEVYHVVYKIIRHTNPRAFKTIQAWHKANLDHGGDPTLTISEAFSQAMAEEELGYASSLPKRVVRHAKKIFSNKNSVSPLVMQEVKNHWSQT